MLTVWQFSVFALCLLSVFRVPSATQSENQVVECAAAGNQDEAYEKTLLMTKSAPFQEGNALLSEDESLQDAKQANRGKTTEQPKAVSLTKKCVAEFIAMTLFVIFGCGSAMGIAKAPGSAWVFQVAFTFGLAITVLASTIGHYSGGHINCAVTFGLLVAGQIGGMEAICIVLSQLTGSVMGAGILSCMYPMDKDLTGSLGSNVVSKEFSKPAAVLAECLGTFLLMYTVLETAVNPATEAGRVMACLVIGFSVFLAHSVLIPIDGCSINPTRSLGPAFVAKLRGGEDTFSDMWVFWVGPLLGAASAAGVYRLMAPFS